MEGIDITPAAREEFSRLAEILAEAEFWQRKGHGYDEAVVYLKSFDPSHSEMHVARLEKEIVGLVWFSLKGMFYQFGFIYLLAVTPDCRDRGIGTELMRYAEDRLLKYSRGVFLLVSDFNEGARRFYERLGYEFYSLLPNYKGEGNDEILMWKPDWTIEEQDG